MRHHLKQGSGCRLPPVVVLGLRDGLQDLLQGVGHLAVFGGCEVVMVDRTQELALLVQEFCTPSANGCSFRFRACC